MRRPLLVAGLAATLAVLALAAGPTPASAARPNVVVVMTDDQTVAHMRALPDTQRLVGGRGVTFATSYATHPLCCPSRATYLTGQYSHNHGVRSNEPPDGGYEAFRERKALPVWLRRAGYKTMLVGKYLNGYNRHREEVPRGWDRWAALAGLVRMYDYRLNVDGRLVEYGDAPRDYATDVYARKARSFVRDQHQAGGPFFLTVTPTAPHLDDDLPVGAPNNPRPAPRHAGSFADEPVPRPPSFDEADVGDKPDSIQELPRLDNETEEDIDNRWRAALASLRAVDDLVVGLIDTLKSTGEMDDTLFVFTSDNGYSYGEHRRPKGKNEIYEEVARVPLMMRGPGVPEGALRGQLAGNIDLAPTILDAARAEADLKLDGRSLIPLADDPGRGTGRDLVVESEDFSAVRAGRWIYSDNEGEQNELYDLAADPFQLENVAGAPEHAVTRSWLDRRLDDLRDCAGKECR